MFCTSENSTPSVMRSKNLMRMASPFVFGIMLLLMLAGGVGGQDVTVLTSFPEKPVLPELPEDGIWYNWYTTNMGTVSTVMLEDEANNSNLLVSPPGGDGAGKLTTAESDVEEPNSSRANVGIANPFCGATVVDILPSLELGYSFFKSEIDGIIDNAFAAAALKIEIYNPLCVPCPTCDSCYTNLVYEPYLNPPNTNPMTNTWLTESISANTGAGDANKDGFWSTGGFGAVNTSGGPPIKSLHEWSASMGSYFDNAFVVSVQIGVGSYNLDQEAYFDNVSIKHANADGLDVVFDVEPPASSEEENGGSKKKKSGKTDERVMSICNNNKGSSSKKSKRSTKKSKGDLLI